MGLTYAQALDIPFSELLDLIFIEQVKREGAKLKQEEDEDAFFELLNWR